MNKGIKELIVITFWVVLVVVVIISLMWFGLIKPQVELTKICTDKLGLDYDFWKDETGSEYPHYVFIDNHHFNCCWDEIYLVDDEYYKKEKCKGFVK